MGKICLNEYDMIGLMSDVGLGIAKLQREISDVKNKEDMFVEDSINKRQLQSNRIYLNSELEAKYHTRDKLINIREQMKKTTFCIDTEE